MRLPSRTLVFPPTASHWPDTDHKSSPVLIISQFSYTTADWLTDTHTHAHTYSIHFKSRKNSYLFPTLISALSPYLPLPGHFSLLLLLLLPLCASSCPSICSISFVYSLFSISSLSVTRLVYLRCCQPWFNRIYLTYFRFFLWYLGFKVTDMVE